MKNVLRASRRRKFQALAATAAIAGAGAVAAIVPAVTASASTASPKAPAVAAKCANSALRVWLGVPGDGTAGSVFYQLELSNISGRACTLHGYPGVSAIGPHGVQLGSAAGRSAGDPERVVTLARGATAHVLLQIADTGVYSRSACEPKNAVGLKVYPPNDTAAQTVPFTFSACGQKGPVYLHVRVTVAGTGIPAYSS